MEGAHIVEFMPSGRGKAQCAPDPRYPDGKDIDISDGALACAIQLPYPAPECGAWVVKCNACERGAIAITAAGRPDDPRLVKIPCIRGDKPCTS